MGALHLHLTELKAKKRRGKRAEGWHRGFAWIFFLVAHDAKSGGSWFPVAWLLKAPWRKCHLGGKKWTLSSTKKLKSKDPTQ